MKPRQFFAWTTLLLILCVPALAQAPGTGTNPAGGAAPSGGPPGAGGGPGGPSPGFDGASFVDPSQLHLDYLLFPPPPSDKNSEAEKADLAELHRIEQTRTPAQVAAAQADDQQKDIFIYRTVLGEKFIAANLPMTAALSEGVYRQASAAIGPLKALYQRPRPYHFDSTLHPVCETTTQPTSYPSGHTIIGYLEAFTLVQIVPEKHQAILERADEYAYNREVCGVHYPTDVASGKEVAYAVFGEMMTSAEFQKALAAARVETRKALGLN
jgi:acid phosphatase (class A)